MSRKVYKYVFLLIFVFIICINRVEAQKISDVNIGDYIKMTPTSTSYVPSSSDTGCLNDDNCKQNILNPSELNLWRVIRKNKDGTVDVVSEYVSSEKILFYGKTGYMNLIKGLNTIAAQYTNTKYVQSTRYVGYNNQIERCSTFSLDECPADEEYKTDIELIKAAIGTMVSKNKNGVNTTYWLASRSILTVDSLSTFYGRVVSKNDLFDTTRLVEVDTPIKSELSVRPILTLKSDIDLPKKSSDGVYDLDNLNGEEEQNPTDPKNPVEDINGGGQDNIKDEQNNNENQQGSSKNEIENPNTGNFLICILFFLIVILGVVVLNITKTKRMFKI